MANAFLKAERIVSQGLGLLQRELVLPRLVTRYGRADFQNAKDDTISVKVPAILTAREYEWRTRTTAITYDDLEEFSVDVKLDKHPYSAVTITDEELTLDITSWGDQVAMPQIRAVAEKLESYIAEAMYTAPYAETVAYDPPANPDADDLTFFTVLAEARKILNEANVPQAGRVALLGAEVEFQALRSPHLVRANEAASNEVLRNAIIGQVAGFTVVSSNSVAPGFAVAFHPTAFAFANVAPEVPAGAAAGAAATYADLAMRWIRDYDPDHLRDRSVYSSFAGSASVNDGRDTNGDLTDENVRAVEIVFSGAS